MLNVDFDRTFRNFMSDYDYGLNADVVESETEYEILADVPGVDKKDILISLENSILTVTAKRERAPGKLKFVSDKRWLGTSKVSYKLNFNAEDKDIKADLDSGVLHIRIPKARESIRRIEIN